MPGECDGVVLLEDVGGGGPISEFLGYSWLVTSQQVTPLRARFWMGPERLEFEVRFGIADLCVPQDELDRLWRRGRFPEWSDEWAVLLRE